MFRKEITVFLKNQDVYEGFLYESDESDELDNYIVVVCPKLIERAIGTNLNIINPTSLKIMNFTSWSLKKMK